MKLRLILDLSVTVGSYPWYRLEAQNGEGSEYWRQITSGDEGSVRRVFDHIKKTGSETVIVEEYDTDTLL